MRNWQTPPGTELVTASGNAVDYVGLTVLTASDITYTDSLGGVTVLTAVPAGITIMCQIVKVTVCSAIVLAMKNR